MDSQLVYYHLTPLFLSAVEDCESSVGEIIALTLMAKELEKGREAGLPKRWIISLFVEDFGFTLEEAFNNFRQMRNSGCLLRERRRHPNERGHRPHVHANFRLSREAHRKLNEFARILGATSPGSGCS